MRHRHSNDSLPTSTPEFTLTIESVAYGGSGLGHKNGKVVFVPGTLPGDRVRVLTRKEKTNHINAALKQIIEPSPIRTAPEPGFIIPKSSLAYSPGFCYFYTDYENELIIKQTQFRSLMEKEMVLGNGTILDPIASPVPTHYRNKIKLNVEDDHGTIRLGYVMANNETVLNLPLCPLAVNPINDYLAELNSQPGFRHSLKQGMELTLRYTEHNGVVFWRNKPDRNMSWLREETALGGISVPCGSFFQVNSVVCNLLLERVGYYLDKIAPDVVLDFYCGIGLFSVAAAQRGIDLTVGIDQDPSAIKAAEYNGNHHNLKNCRFIAGDAGKQAQDVLETYPDARTCLIVDPPRTGMDYRCRSLIANSGINDILYISCSSDTLARDIASLAKNGYQVIETQLLDMFPRTAHFESLTHLKLG
ncbi:hypothetical protein BVX99_00955 [bacterium F16]|nr:hypothetical protein BVX99_00955 [bacterium F16]